MQSLQVAKPAPQDLCVGFIEQVGRPHGERTAAHSEGFKSPIDYLSIGSVIHQIMNPASFPVNSTVYRLHVFRDSTNVMFKKLCIQECMIVCTSHLKSSISAVFCQGGYIRFLIVES